jgi:drug/metabolite transporter (DMT)-like permease
VPVGRWLPELLALAAIWGSSFMFIKIGVSQLPPLFVSAGRVVSGALTLVVIVLVNRDRLPRDLGTWGHNGVVGILGVAAPFSLFAYGEQRISSVLAGIWNAATPLVVLPAAVWLFRIERMMTRRAVGLLLGFLGALIILAVWRDVGGASWTGQLLCLAAAICYGIAIPYTRRFIAGRPGSGAAMSLCQLVVASAVLVVIAPLASPALPAIGQLSGTVIASVIALGALGTGVAFVLNMRNIRMIGASAASMVTYIVPVFAAVVGILVLGESLSWNEPLGALVVLLGVAVSQGLLAPAIARSGRPLGKRGRTEPAEATAGTAGVGQEDRD